MTNEQSDIIAGPTWRKWVVGLLACGLVACAARGDTVNPADRALRADPGSMATTGAERAGTGGDGTIAVIGGGGADGGTGGVHG
jgi:hypothetical protein